MNPLSLPLSKGENFCVKLPLGKGEKMSALLRFALGRGEDLAARSHGKRTGIY